MIKVANFISTTLGENIGAATTAFSLASTTGFPVLGAGDYFYLVLVRNSDNAKEIIKVTGYTAGQITACDRAQEDTEALAFVTGDVAAMWLTAQTLIDIAAVPSITFNVTNGANSSTIEAQVSKAGYFLIRAWLIDGTTPTEQKSLKPPSASDITLWEKVTDSDGLLTLTVEHTGAEQTWYGGAVVLAEVQISDAVTLGS